MKNILMVYFTGTGGTKRIAETFEEIFNERKYNTIKYALDLSINKTGFNHCNEILKNVELLIVLYPVYAFDAPQPIYEWIKELPFETNIPTVVISVSGGGKIWPNTLCRVACIKALEKKGCNVVYEKMIVMPSNFVLRTNDHLSMWLLKNIPLKANKIVEDVIKGKKHRSPHKFGVRLVQFISKLEKKNAGSFGLSLKTKESCNGCGWCAINCPRNNIRLNEKIPTFFDQCIICMRCIYGCPSKAIYSEKYKFIIIKDGYSINSIEQRMNGKELKSVRESSKGILWAGVRKYLLEKD